MAPSFLVFSWHFSWHSIVVRRLDSSNYFCHAYNRFSRTGFAFINPAMDIWFLATASVCLKTISTLFPDPPNHRWLETSNIGRVGHVIRWRFDQQL